MLEMTLRELLDFCKEKDIKLILKYHGSMQQFEIILRKSDFSVGSTLECDLLNSPDAGLIIGRILNKMLEDIDKELDSRQWVSIQEKLPPDRQIVQVKIDDENGLRNEGRLYFHNHLWWIPNGSMYVYYRPTHWKPA